jgi:hypothetical protein
MELYQQGHLLVAAIRILEHGQKKQPSLTDICTCLSLSEESGHLICRKLLGLGVVEAVEKPDGIRLFIRDHLKLEEIPRTQETDRFHEEIEKFKASQKGLANKIEALKASNSEKKKSLFADLEDKLKKQLEAKKKGAVKGP